MYAFENSIKASRGSISKAIRHGKSIGSNVVENILIEYPELNSQWLFTGKGEMILKTENSFDAIDKIEVVKHLKDNLEEYKNIRSFRLLLESTQGDNELTKVKSDIENLKKKVEGIIKSKDS